MGGADEDDVESADDVMAVQDDGTALTGAAARNARKQRREERDKARLQRMSQSVAARRAQDARKSQKQSEEEARLLRVAQKAAARRAARGGDAGGEPGRAEGEAAGGDAAGGGGAGGEEAPQGGQPAKPPAQEGAATRDPEGGPQPPARAGRRREGRAARKAEQEEAGRGRSRSREQRRQKRQERQGRERAGGAERAGGRERGGGPEGRPEVRAGGERRHRRAKDQPAEPPASAERRAAKGGPPRAADTGGQGGPGAGEASGSESSDSSSSSSSSSSPSSPSAHAMAVAKAMAMGGPIPFSAPSKTPSFSWERTLIPSSTSGLPTPQSAIFNGPPVVSPLSSSTELEQFLQAGGVDGEAAVRLRQLPPQLQRMVMDRGPVAGTRNPSSVVISRVKEVEALRLGAMPGAGLLGFGAPGAGLGAGGAGGGPPLPPCPEVEGMISRYNLDAQASAMLRRLPPEQQRLAARLPVHEARNASAYVLTQLSMPRLLGTGEATRLPTQPHDPTAMMISGMLRRV